MTSENRRDISHFVVVVHFTIRPSDAGLFLELVTRNATDSLQEEPGCSQFDVVIEADNPASIYLYEIYEDAPAFKAHLNTAHFASFDSATASMVLSKTVITGNRHTDGSNGKSAPTGALIRSSP